MLLELDGRGCPCEHSCMLDNLGPQMTCGMSSRLLSYSSHNHLDAGKTTLLKILGGKHMVPRGSVQVLGSAPFHDTSLTASGELSYIGGNWERDVAFAGYSVPLQVKAALLWRHPVPCPDMCAVHESRQTPRGPQEHDLLSARSTRLQQCCSSQFSAQDCKILSSQGLRVSPEPNTGQQRCLLAPVGLLAGGMDSVCAGCRETSPPRA